MSLSARTSGLLRASRWLCIGLLGACLVGCGGTPDLDLDLGEEAPAENEAAVEHSMIVLIKQISEDRRARDPDGLMRRFNQARTIGCVTGVMRVDAPPSHAHGLFQTARTYPVTLRFANASQLDDREADFRGLSIRVHDVADATGAGGTPAVQDFTLNNYPALIAGTPEDFLDFVRASGQGTLGMLWFLVTHPGSIPIVFGGRGHPTSPLVVDYYSTTPFRWGVSGAMKYSVRACEAPGSRVAADHADYLRAALQHDLSLVPQCLEFRVQAQTDAALMPMEDASVTWPEDVSPFVTVAHIDLPVQTVDDEASLEACERMTFNPWNALPGHRPLGGINRVRNRLYTELGRFRNLSN